MNVLLCTATEFWALRYPDSHDLNVLDRRGAVGAFELRTGRIRASSGHLTRLPSVVFATERMDGNPAWRLLDAGELVHVDADLNITRRLAFPDPPCHLLRRAGLRACLTRAPHCWLARHLSRMRRSRLVGRPAPRSRAATGADVVGGGGGVRSR